MPKVTVKLGNRVYDARSWKRRDVIFVGDKMIGVIHLSEHDRMGSTTCLASSEKRPGRKIDWCVNESIKRHVVAPCDLLNFRNSIYQEAAAA